MVLGDYFGKLTIGHVIIMKIIIIVTRTHTNSLKGLIYQGIYYALCKFYIFITCVLIFLCNIVKRSQKFIIVLCYNFVSYFTAGSSRDGEPTMPEALLDNKHEMDDWRHVDTVSYLSFDAFFKPFHWPRAHHVTCKLLPTNNRQLLRSTVKSH